MKLLYSLVLFFSLFAGLTGTIDAQTTCNENFTVTTTSTPSTCQSNGTITVTLGGDITDIFNVQYGVSSQDGFLINPQESNVLTNIPPGTYEVTVRAFCRINSDYDVVKTISNVVVGGNYIVPTASFNATSSRKSYDICDTGIIALNVNNGSGTFTFTITSAPTGVPTGVITPTKSGTLYTFPGENYPSGNYEVQINDGCYTTVCAFELGQVTGFPAFTYSSYTGFRPTLVDNTCTTVYWYAGAVTTANADYYRYYQDGMYQVGAAPYNTTIPTNWTDWTAANLSSSRLLLDISPNNYINFYPGTTTTISVYTRLKGCDTGYSIINTYIKAPSMTNAVTLRTCEDYVYTIRPWTDYDGVFCYPLSVEVTKVSDGSVVFTNPSWSYNSSGIPVTLEYNVNYRVTMTGADGKVASTTTNQNRNLVFTTDILNCDTYQIRYYAPTYTTCWPVTVTITDESGNLVCTNTFSTTATQTSCELQYGVNYTVTMTYDTDPSFVYTVTKKLDSAFPTAYTMSLYSSTSYCYENYGYINVTRVGAGTYPAGTKVTITGPAGYTSQTVTTSSSSTSSISMGYTTLPPGEYTATIDHGCGTPITAVVTLNGAYSGNALDYITENTCSGMKVTPTGLMTYQGSSTTTYYRLISGPTGYDKTVITPGGYFVFSAPGTYVLGIMVTNSATACAFKQVTIEYTAPPLALSGTETSAYVCTDDATGVIRLKAINGVAPYTYQLWNEENTAKVGVADIESSGAVNFMYGTSGATYTARIIDQCGNMFSQQITMARLKDARVVYTPNNNVCTDGSIELKCITLGETMYKWTGPNGFTSDSQSPTRPDADVSMSGWYKVTVMPEFCGDPMQDSVYINVYHPLIAGQVTAPQEICVRTLVQTPLNCTVTGGSGIYTYQWQISTDGTSTWSNITGANTVSYTPTVQIRSGIYYYRVLTTDICGTVESAPITVNVTPCYIPINPHIRGRADQ